MDASIRQYIDEGPVVYIGSIDSVKVSAGVNQVKLSWAPSSDSRIKGAIIYWKNRECKQEVSWDPSQPFETVVTDLPEGSVLFEIVTCDSHGNVSVPVSISGNVYGPSFANLIDDTATITSGFFDETAHTVDLGFKHSSNYYYRGLKLTYHTLAQTDSTVMLPKDSTMIRLENVASPEIFYSAFFLPEEGSIDMFFAESHRYEDLFNPFCEVTGALNPKLSYMSGATASTTFQANRAPVTVTVPDGSWVSASVEGQTVKISSTETNATGANRDAVITLHAGDFENNITVTQVKDIRGTAYGNEGIIFWQDAADYSQYKIISAARGNCQWATENVYLGLALGTYQMAGTAANMAKWLSATGSSTIGGILTPNNDVIGAQDPASYPAFTWCKNLGPGWYLPSALELREVFAVYNGCDFDAATAAVPNNITAAEKAARDTFDNLMVSMGGEKLNTQDGSKAGDWVWDNMEEAGKTDGTKACGFRFGNRGHGARSKQNDGSSSDPFYTRAVKIVTILDI